MRRPNSEHPPKADPDSLMADFLLVFSDPKALMVLDALRKEELTPSAVSRQLGISQNIASAKLQVMARKGILASNSNSGGASYRIADSIILQARDRILEFANPEPKCSVLVSK